MKMFNNAFLFILAKYSTISCIQYDNMDKKFLVERLFLEGWKMNLFD